MEDVPEEKNSKKPKRFHNREIDFLTAATRKRKRTKNRRGKKRQRFTEFMDEKDVMSAWSVLFDRSFNTKGLDLNHPGLAHVKRAKEGGAYNPSPIWLKGRLMRDHYILRRREEKRSLDWQIQYENNGEPKLDAQEMVNHFVSQISCPNFAIPKWFKGRTVNLKEYIITPCEDLNTTKIYMNPCMSLNDGVISLEDIQDICESFDRSPKEMEATLLYDLSGRPLPTRQRYASVLAPMISIVDSLEHLWMFNRNVCVSALLWYEEYGNLPLHWYPDGKPWWASSCRSTYKPYITDTMIEVGKPAPPLVAAGFGYTYILDMRQVVRMADRLWMFFQGRPEKSKLIRNFDSTVIKTYLFLVRAKHICVEEGKELEPLEVEQGSYDINVAATVYRAMQKIPSTNFLSAEMKVFYTQATGKMLTHSLDTFYAFFDVEDQVERKVDSDEEDNTSDAAEKEHKDEGKPSFPIPVYVPVGPDGLEELQIQDDESADKTASIMKELTASILSRDYVQMSQPSILERGEELENDAQELISALKDSRLSQSDDDVIGVGESVMNFDDLINIKYSDSDQDSSLEEVVQAKSDDELPRPEEVSIEDKLENYGEGQEANDTLYLSDDDKKEIKKSIVEELLSSIDSNLSTFDKPPKLKRRRVGSLEWELEHVGRPIYLDLRVMKLSSEGFPRGMSIQSVCSQQSKIWDPGPTVHTARFAGRNRR